MTEKLWIKYYEIEIRKLELMDQLLEWVAWAKAEIERLKMEILITFKDSILDEIIDLKYHVDDSLNMIHKHLYV